MLNKVMLIGNLGADPELRQTSSGQAVCEMRICTSESWFDKASNERKERQEWHKVTVWGKIGENCAKYLSKGKRCYVEGRIQTEEWEKDGVKRYTTKIVAQSVQFLSPKNEGGGQRDQGGSGGGGESGGLGKGQLPGKSFSDDEIPF
tara:strand:- start:612 stop:1052 length:441 start_codon:yes stop_codon:yes gene_type:complete